MKEEMSLAEYHAYLSGQKQTESRRNSRNRKKGDKGESLVKKALISAGLDMVEKIEVGWGIVRDQKGRIKNAYPLSKVSGDYRAITPKGQSVLVEVKTTSEPKLLWSAVKKHQREALDTHANVGGISLLAWVYDNEVYLMWWPVEGFVKRTSLTVEQAIANRWHSKF